MKKILVLLMVMVLGACSPSTEPYEDADLLNQIEILEQSNTGLLLKITDILAELDNLENYNDEEVYTALEDITYQLNSFIIEYNEFDDTALQADIEALNLALAELTERLDNITVVTGLNGQISIFEKTGTEIQMLQEIIVELKDTFDKSKAPDYIIDEFGEFVTQQEVGRLLKEKYYNDTTLGTVGIAEDWFSVGSIARYQFAFDTEFTTEEILARTVLLIQELQQYTFYNISSSEMTISVYYSQDGNTNALHITIPLVTAINGFFEINLDGILSEDYMMVIDIGVVNQTEAQALYDEFILLETFSGFVLDYD